MPQLGMGQCSFSSVHPSCSFFDISTDTIVVAPAQRLCACGGGCGGITGFRVSRGYAFNFSSFFWLACDF